MSRYLSWPETKWPRVLMSTHHFWFIPTCVLLVAPWPAAAHYLATRGGGGAGGVCAAPALWRGGRLGGSHGGAFGWRACVRARAVRPARIVLRRLLVVVCQ